MSNSKDKKAKTPEAQKAKLRKQQKALKARVLAVQYAALFKEFNFNKTPEQFNNWLRDLNQEKRHCVQMTLAVTRIFVELAVVQLNEMSDDTLLAFKRNDRFAGLLKVLRYQIIYKLKKDLATNDGELKADRNELKGSPHNIKCDCLLN